MTTDQSSRSSTTTTTRSPSDSPTTAPPGSRAGSQGSSGSQDMRAKAGEAVSKLTDAAQQAGSQAKQAASSLASEANQKAKGLLNQQVAAGADLVGHVADSAKSAADSLDRTAPQLAGLVRGAADRIEDFSRDIRGQSVEELIKAASDFTRRQPALVFGLASVAGFLLVRVLKSSPPNYSPSHSQGGQYRDQGFGESRGTRSGPSASQFHGV
jgi:ElaB/YqjD/DUF883 family membrane-anchored ribosome-binding protein